VPDVDVDLVDLEEGFFARGRGCVGGQFYFRRDTLLVQLPVSPKGFTVRWGKGT
jgi:hypothetical protein